MAGGPRNVLASIVGWAIVAIVVFVLLGALVATLGVLVRFVIWAIVIGALITLYMNLKGPDD